MCVLRQIKTLFFVTFARHGSVRSPRCLLKVACWYVFYQSCYSHCKCCFSNMPYFRRIYGRGLGTLSLLLIYISPCCLYYVNWTLYGGLQEPRYVDPLNLTAMACPALPMCPLAITEAERGTPDLLKRVRAVFEKVFIKTICLILYFEVIPSC